MNPRTILHVEDDLDAAFFLKRALKRSPLEIVLKHVQDGEEAIHYLDGSAPFEDRLKNPLPNLIFLDLKLPRKDGFEVLSWIRDRGFGESVPVVVLTSSDRQDDMDRAKNLGAALYLTKTVDFKEAIKTATQLLV